MLGTSNGADVTLAAWHRAFHTSDTRCIRQLYGNTKTHNTAPRSYDE